MPLNNKEKLQVIKGFVPEILGKGDEAWYMDGGNKTRYASPGDKWGCEPLLALIHFNTPLDVIIDERAFDSYCQRSNTLQIGIEELRFYSGGVWLIGVQYFFTELFHFDHLIDYSRFLKSYITNPLNPESRQIRGLRDLIFAFSSHNLRHYDNCEVLVNSFSNELDAIKIDCFGILEHIEAAALVCQGAETLERK